MRLTWLNIAGLLFVSISLASCATMFNYGNKTLSITSEPSGASVKWNDLDPACKTPCTLDLTKGSTYFHDFLVEKTGYEDYSFVQTNPIHWTFFLNLGFLYLGIVGMATDYLTGAIYTVRPSEKNLVLTPTEDEEGEDEDADEETELRDSESNGDESSDQPIPELPTTKLMTSIREMFPDNIVDRQILLYYGNQSTRQTTIIRHR